MSNSLFGTPVLKHIHISLLRSPVNQMYLLGDNDMHEIVFQSPVALNVINLKSPVIKGITLFHTLNIFPLNEYKRSDSLFNLHGDFMNDSLSPNV